MLSGLIWESFMMGWTIVLIGFLYFLYQYVVYPMVLVENLLHHSSVL